MKFNIVMDITTFKGLMANKISLAQKYLYNNPHEERVTQSHLATSTMLAVLRLKRAGILL